MVSDLLKAALEAEIVGQPGAVQAVVRGTVRSAPLSAMAR